MEKFIEFAREKGLLLDEGDIIIDDNIHRVPVEGARRINSKDGAYCIYSDGVGWVKNFRTGEYGSISLHSGESKSDTQIIQRKVVERENKEHFTHNKVAGTANYLIEKQFKRANNHKYLYTKKIQPFGALIDKYGVLIIPMQNIGGEYRSFQRIYEDGSKSFLSGGQKKNCFFKIGIIAEVVVICEGYATACSIYECTKLPTLAAMDASNLVNVALEVRRRYGDNLRIIVAGDDDRLQDDNPGRRYATLTAEVVGGEVVFPSIRDEDFKKGWSDFNDAHANYGKSSVQIDFMISEAKDGKY